MERTFEIREEMNRQVIVGIINKFVKAFKGLIRQSDINRVIKLYLDWNVAHDTVIESIESRVLLENIGEIVHDQQSYGSVQNCCKYLSKIILKSEAEVVQDQYSEIGSELLNLLDYGRVNYLE